MPQPAPLADLPPALNLVIDRCCQEHWSLFSRHHYKSQTLSKTALCFCLKRADNGKPVGLAAVIRHNGRANRGGLPYWAHRTVVLPRYQGMGIGGKFTDAVGELFSNGISVFWTDRPPHPFGGHRGQKPTVEGFGVEPFCARIEVTEG